MASTVKHRVYSLGTVKPWVASAADLIGNMFGITTVGGYREHGSVKNSDHPKGLALDFMTNNQNTGNAIRDYAIQHAGQLGVHYVIYNRKIYTSENEWQPRDYDGPSPHTDHVHISFNDKAGTGATTETTQVGWTDPSSWPVISQLNSAADKLTSPDWWKRLGLYALGTLLVVAGFVVLFRKPIEQAVGTAVKAKTGGVG